MGNVLPKQTDKGSESILGPRLEEWFQVWESRIMAWPWEEEEKDERKNIRMNEKSPVFYTADIEQYKRWDHLAGALVLLWNDV